MGKYMCDEEFRNCNSINVKEIYAINDELESKGIYELSSKIEYVKENCDGHIYLYFMLQELDNKILMNYNAVPGQYTFSKEAVDGLLRSYMFAVQYMQEKLPEHAYNYIKSKSSTFVYELEESLKKIK